MMRETAEWAPSQGHMRITRLMWELLPPTHKDVVAPLARYKEKREAAKGKAPKASGGPKARPKPKPEFKVPLIPMKARSSGGMPAAGE